VDFSLLALVKSLGAPLWKGLGYMLAKWKRPVVKYSKAPKNLLEHVRPNISVERVKEILGAPHNADKEQLRYLFSDCCVQVDFDEQQSVHSVSLGLSRVSLRTRFEVWPIDKLVLGKTTFASMIENEIVELNKSSKFYHFYVVKNFGNHGHYKNYAIGVLACAGVGGVKEHWSPEQQPISEIPPKMVVNWVCVTNLEAPPGFNYFGFYY
jgi:hypothetical protein